MHQISVVIPCYPPHLTGLVACVKSVRDQTLQPDEIVVALSSCSPELAETTLPLLREAAGNIPVVLSSVQSAANAAQNRNRGLRVSQHPIVSFFDADDCMRRQRLERVVSLMALHDADAVLHSFEKGGTDMESPLTGRVWTPEEMAHLDQKDRTCIHLTQIHVTHGHITVRRHVSDIVEQDPEAHLCEDSAYVRSLFHHKLRVVYTQDVLSNYYPNPHT